jgi:hypothetical protein
MSPPDTQPDDTVIVDLTEFVAGSTRETVASDALMTHTESGPTARKLASRPTSTVATVAPEVPSIRTICRKW